MQKGIEAMNKELEMVRLACKAMDEKKALDIKVIDIHEVSVIADYFKRKQLKSGTGNGRQRRGTARTCRL